MLKYTIIIPFADNNGEAFPPKHYLKLLNKAKDLGIAGGSFFKPSSKFIGFWYNKNNKLYQEANGYFTTSGTAKIKGKIKQLAEYAKELYKQEAIYCEAIQADINFI